MRLSTRGLLLAGGVAAAAVLCARPIITRDFYIAARASSSSVAALPAVVAAGTVERDLVEAVRIYRPVDAGALKMDELKVKVYYHHAGAVTTALRTCKADPGADLVCTP